MAKSKAQPPKPVFQRLCCSYEGTDLKVCTRRDAACPPLITIDGSSHLLNGQQEVKNCIECLKRDRVKPTKK